MYLSDDMRKRIKEGMILAVKDSRRKSWGVIISAHGGGMAIAMVIIGIFGVETNGLSFDLIRILMMSLIFIGFYVQIVWSKKKRDQDLANFGDGH